MATSSETRAHSRPGRPRPGDRKVREGEIMDAALSLLFEGGWRKCTMSAVAERAGASKETLYGWYGDKESLLAAIVQREAEATNIGVREALDTNDAPEAVLTSFARNLLRLLLGERAVAINRAALGEVESSPAVAQILLREGRHRTGELVEEYLASLSSHGIPIQDAAAAFQLLYGLVVQDLQIRALLGEGILERPQVDRHAEAAVRRFLLLVRRGEV